MSEQLIHVQTSTEFRDRAQRLGFAGDPELIRHTVQAQIQHGLPEPDGDGRHWFSRLAVPSGPGLERPELWLGAMLEGDSLILEEIRLQPPSGD